MKSCCRSTPSIVLALALACAPAFAAPPARPATPPHAHEPANDPVERALVESRTPDVLRARLLEIAKAPPSPRVGLEAWQMRGLSFDHAAQLDSAIACYRLASNPRNPGGYFALVDALLRHRSTGDVEEAIDLLARLQDDDEPGRIGLRPDPARLGWAYVLAGQASRGIELLAPMEARLADDPQWRYRIGRAYIDAGRSTKAVDLLLLLNTLSRGQDRDVAKMLHHLDAALGANAHLHERAIEQQQQHDDAEIAWLTRLGGRRVRIVASDGAMIGGALFADSTARRPARAAVVLASVGDDLRDYDSLTVALRSSGFAVFVLDPRGSGWSVAPEFSLPDTWQGREDALAARVVTDVHDALHAFARVAKIDTTRVLLAGIGTMAPVAVRAAAAEPRVAALALIDPWTSPVDRGVVLAAANDAAVPVYVHVGVQARTETAFADTLFHTFPPRTSRMDDSPALQSGARAFGSRPDVTTRFVRWLGETYAGPAKPRRATPRAPRQRG